MLENLNRIALLERLGNLKSALLDIGSFENLINSPSRTIIENLITALLVPLARKILALAG